MKAAAISLCFSCYVLAAATTITANSLPTSILDGIIYTQNKHAKQMEFSARRRRSRQNDNVIGAGQIIAERSHSCRGKCGSRHSESASAVSSQMCREKYLAGFVTHRNSVTKQNIPSKSHLTAFFDEVSAKEKSQNWSYQAQNVKKSMLLPARRAMLTKRNLFSFNLNSGGDKQKDKDKQTPNEDLPPWLRALKRLQFLSSLSVEEERDMLSELSEGKDLDEIDEVAASIDTLKGSGGDDIFSGSVPLASLINVDALLLANSQDGLDEYVDKVDSNKIDATSAPSNEDISNMQQKQIRSFTSIRDLSSKETSKPETPLELLPSLLELGDLNKLFRSLTELQETIADNADSESDTLAEYKEINDSSFASFEGDAGITTDSILKDATAKIEKFLTDASSAISPAIVQDLIFRASQSIDLNEGADGIKAAADGFVDFTEELAFKQGLDVTKAAGLARATAQYTTDWVQWANGVLLSGYVSKDKKLQGAVNSFSAEAVPAAFTSVAKKATASKPLFHGFSTVQELSKSDYSQSLAKAAELSKLAGAIYQNMIPLTHSIDHAIVANGTFADVAWMVTDSIGYEKDFADSEHMKDTECRPTMVRTLTIRGFDAADESVDREKLLNLVCRASPEEVVDDVGVVVHSGLLSVARELYKELKPFIDLSAPTHKIVLNGHSIGGSLSVLLLMLIAVDYGADFVNEKIMRVFTFGSPPVAMMKGLTDCFEKLDNVDRLMTDKDARRNSGCNILRAFGLKESIVYGYVQPWDPIPRLFSRIDPLYPLIGDLGEDGVTLYASGPPRTLRPITRAIIESWQGWQDFRDNESIFQAYISVGVQHLLMPEPIRYLTDRLVSVNVAVPPIHSVLRISSDELLPALEETFPLDAFGISLVPAALRSFIHHFYPAYMDTFTEYTGDKDNTGEGKTEINGQKKKAGPNNDVKITDKSRYEARMEPQKKNITINRSPKAEKRVPRFEWTQAAASFVLGSI